MFPSSRSRHLPRRGKIWRGAALAVCLGMVGLLVSACTGEPGTPLGARDACADRRLQAAVISYEDAKSEFAEHFKGRSDVALVYAFHASQDSERLARALGQCFDFDANHRTAGIELIRSNQILQTLIVTNLRDSDPGVVIALFGEDYRDFIKNDIH